MTLPDSPNGAWMHRVFFRQSGSDVVDVPVVMFIEHLEYNGLGSIRAAVPRSATLRASLLGEKSVDSRCFVSGHPVVDRRPADFYGACCFCDGNLAGEDTVNERGFHGCELVSVVGFHASTLNEYVNLIAAIRTNFVKYCLNCSI